MRFFKILIWLLLAFTNLKALALTVTVDNLKYSTFSNTARVVGFENNPSQDIDLVIPEFIEYEGNTYYVTVIGDSAFNNCSSLTSVIIPNIVSSIGNSAFSNCIGLTSVIIPNSVFDIGNDAFSGCSSLTSVTIGNSVTSIGDSAFGGCSSLTSVTIPNSVTSIGSRAFEYCNRLTSVTIPNSVTSIGSRAFEYCNRLTSLTIPNSVTSIEYGVFEGCSGLTSVTIPNSVTSIEYDAFKNCIGLTSVTIPNSVTSIDNGAFEGCSGLTSVTLPNSVTSIRSNAFKNCIGLTSVHITDIAAWCKIAFSIGSNPLIYAHHLYLNGKEIKDLVIPNSVTSIGNYAFYGCSLSSVAIPKSVTSIGNYAFYGCSLSSVTIPNSVTSIGSYAFYNCSGLTSVTIPNSVTSIEYGVFEGCSGLTSVTIPNSVTSIGNYAFYGCSGLTSVTIPNSVTSIGSYAFHNCSKLTSLIIPNSVTSIEYGVFEGCSGLTSIIVESGNTKYDSRDKCNAIIEKSSKTLIVGSNNTFIPNSVTSIGDNAFYNCSGLTSVTIPSSVTSIGKSAFRGCSGLSSVTIPNSVTSIGNYAFSGCSGLTSVTIPNSVTSIGSYAFSGCSGLTEIYSMISEPFATNCWSYFILYPNKIVNKDIPLYVPIGSKSKYQATEGWKDFTNIIENDVSTDNTLAMDNLTGYVGKTITLPILLKNEQLITGLQFDLVLPEGVIVAKKANGKNDITVTERMEESYSLSSNTMDDGSVRVTGLSGESIPFTGNSGAIVNVVLQVDESVAEGDYQIQVKNIVLSDVNGVAHKPATASCMLTVKSYVPGDVDDSGDININDAVCIVNYILNKPNAKFIPEAADLDGSGDININDAVVLINKYILKRANAKAMKAPRRAATGTDNYLSIGAISIKPGETKTVSVDMTNTEGIQGLQCSIDLPEGLSFATKSNGKIDISNNTDRGDGFTLSSSLQEDGSLTVATVNFEGDSYYGNSGTIFSFKITANEDLAAGEYEIKVCDIVLSSGVAIKPSDATGKVTVSNSETGLQQIESDSKQSDSIYNLNGQRVNNPSRGIYIVNGRKVIVK